MAVCAGIGVLIERLAYRPVRQHSRLTSLITAIGVSLLLEYGGQMVFGATPRFFPQMIRSTTYTFGGVQITNQSLLIIVVAVIVMFGLQFIVHRTRIGKAMRDLVQLVGGQTHGHQHRLRDRLHIRARSRSPRRVASWWRSRFRESIR
jgi:branched-chain amino acid transport system permease protein